MNIGYVGLGSMGGALARRLQLKRRMWVFDPDESAVQRLLDAGAVRSGTLGELGSRCEVIMLCLPTSDEVRAVIFDECGLAAAVSPGTIIIDQTSGDPNATRAMASELAKRQIHFIDAPVSGGPQGAEAGTIAIMVGASSELYERVRPILTDISPNVFHAGGTGTGHIIKLVNNVLSCAQRLLSFEAIALAVKNGMDPGTAVEIVLASGGRNAFIEKIMGPHVLNGRLGEGYTLGLAHKDVRLACQLGIDSGVPMFFGNLTRELYQTCISEMGQDAKVDTAALVIDRLAGTSMVPANHTT
jgi:3-hydroxyisobutyrate dehydrogenase-like beta-hydroxyacid dehydrogenase